MPWSDAIPDEAGGRVVSRRGATLHLLRPAHPAELRVIRSQVTGWAMRHAVPEEVLVDLQLALGEAVANSVEHAYRDAEPGSVAVDLEIRGPDGHGAVAVTVTDQGSWQPIPRITGYRGRGLAVIERLARSVSMSRTRWGTQVCFEIAL